ncbi:MAG: lipopolysaccharide assembly protein LapB [Proteobacteria bacterium]|nr:MAG: lipopolysaccharide assembly protein LapB [Pseudomonadota bacterium]
MTGGFIWVSMALLSGILMGMYLAYVLRNVTTQKKFEQLNHRYFKGLNYLLNDESDKAIDVFIQLAETSHATFEPQLALGNLYRKKGEVDKAIKLHQALIAQAQLPERYRTRALLAIGKDYMSAGLLDRAEVLFAELVELEAHTPEALKWLMDIYQQEQDWQQAIKTATRFQAATGRSMRTNIAHFHCELADVARLQNNDSQALQHLAAALRVDQKSVRAHLSIGLIEQSKNNHQQAIKSFKQAIAADNRFVPIVLEPLVNSFQAIDQQQQLSKYLNTLISGYSGISPVLSLTQLTQQQSGNKAAQSLLRQHLKQTPSFKGLDMLLRLDMGDEADASHPDDEILTQLIEDLLSKQPRLRCRKCGFGAQSVHWQCPSCKNWGVVKPIDDVV